MTLDLVGVLEDGSESAPGVPANPRKTLSVPRGADATIRLVVKARGGATFRPPAVDASNRAELSVRLKPSLTPLLTLVGAVMAPADGPEPGYKFTLDPSHATLLDPVGNGARLLYDVWLVSGGKADAVVPLSAFVVEPAARAPAVIGGP